MDNRDQHFMRLAITLAEQGLQCHAGGPFGAVIVKGDDVVGQGYNCVTSTNDPTAHAEIVAIRAACQHLRTFQLTGCRLYTSCEPCPMCLGAVYWARLDSVYYAATREDAARAGFDDAAFYTEINLPPQERKLPLQQLLREAAWPVFQAWLAQTERVRY